MDWLDTIADDRQRKEIALAKIYARDFHHGTTGHNQLMLIADLASRLDAMESELQLARIAALDDRPPLEQLISAAQAAGAKGTWIVRGATGAVLTWTDSEPPGDILVWLGALELAPPHQVIVLIRIPAGDGGPDGIEFRE